MNVKGPLEFRPVECSWLRFGHVALVIYSMLASYQSICSFASRGGRRYFGIIFVSRRVRNNCEGRARGRPVSYGTAPGVMRFC